MKLSEYQRSRSFFDLVKGHSDFKVKVFDFGRYTQVSDSGPHDPLVFGLLLKGSPILLRMYTRPILIFRTIFEGKLPLIYLTIGLTIFFIITLFQQHIYIFYKGKSYQIVGI